jgi:hypothetical protein
MAWVWRAVAFLSGITAVAGAFALGRLTARPPPAPVVAVAPQPGPPPVVVAAPPRATIHVTSSPSGARIVDATSGVEHCEATPCDITLADDDATPCKGHTILASKKGYVDSRASFKVGDPSVAIAMAPVALARAQRPAGPCNPPYVIDAFGRKTYRPECIVDTQPY